MSATAPHVEFLTRSACTLCDDAEEWLTGASRRLGVSVERIDVDGDPTLAERFGAVVPVLRTPEGVVFAEGRWSRYRTFVHLVSYRLARARRDLSPPDTH